MEDKKGISIRKLAALERAKALGLKRRSPELAALERQAREWKRRKEEKESEVQGPRSKVQRESCILDHVSTVKDQTLDIEPSKHPKITEGFDWQPYRPEQGEGGKKVKDLNAASIWRLARKIMAREWARALRGKSFDSEQASIESKAAKLRLKKAAKEERQEAERRRAHEQREALETAVQTFGRDLLKASKPITPETAEAIFEKALSEVGETIRITWQPDGCHLLLEPWEERRLRRNSGETVPAVFQAIIDDDLKLISYQKEKDPHVLRETQKEVILKTILSSLRKSPQQDFRAFEDAVAEGGRIIRSMQAGEGWKIKFEPWEEMRKRNIERKGRPPVVTYIIKADKNFNHISCERI